MNETESKVKLTKQERRDRAEKKKEEIKNRLKDVFFSVLKEKESWSCAVDAAVNKAKMILKQKPEDKTVIEIGIMRFGEMFKKILKG